jgi:Sulfotransferase domain
LTAAAPPVSKPNLFVVGAAKAATTSLWRYLQAHPDVFMARIKEPHFFSRGGVNGIPVAKTEEAYLALFARAGGAAYRGEASVSYLWDPEAAEVLERWAPDARILISLRDPVERAYSHYWTHVRIGTERRTFREAVDAELEGRHDVLSVPPPYVSRGYYAEQVRPYLELFEHVLVLFFEELVADVRGSMRTVFEFLGLDVRPADRIRPVVHYPFAVPRNDLARRLLGRRALRGLAAFRGPRQRALMQYRKPELEPATRALLREHFALHDERLRALLGRSLPWDFAP